MVVLCVVTVLVVVIGIGAFVLGQGAVSTGREAKRSQPDTPTGVTLPAPDMTTFEDKEAGLTIQYPKIWQKYDAPVSEVRLVVTPGGQDYVSVRVQYTDAVTTPQNLVNIKAVTDGVVGSNNTVKVLQHKAVTINGLIGYYYLYTFTDKNSGLQGAHSHYFLFQGHKMNSLVFQALPTEGYKALEPVFSQILASFRSTPEPPVASAPSTLAPPPPTTVP